MDGEENDRFWPKVHIPGNLDDCWEWRAGTRRGYGQFAIDGKTMIAHRVSWQLFHDEPIAEGMCVLHHCDNPGCVNSAHLFLGTMADNNADRDKKGRQAKGETHSQSKLTRVQVLEIRSRKGQTHRSMAKEFGVNQPTISKVLSGKCWKHIQTEA